MADAACIHEKEETQSTAGAARKSGAGNALVVVRRCATQKRHGRKQQSLNRCGGRSAQRVVVRQRGKAGRRRQCRRSPRSAAEPKSFRCRRGRPHQPSRRFTFSGQYGTRITQQHPAGHHVTQQPHRSNERQVRTTSADSTEEAE